MKFLVELDHPKTGLPLTEEAARALFAGLILPTLARAEQLMQTGQILAGGAVAGRIALRFIAEVETPLQLDQLVASLLVWTIAETRVTPLVDFSDRRANMQGLIQRLPTD
jgi:hypothetical protein